MKAHIRKCGDCNFYTAVVGDEKPRQQTNARRRMQAVQSELDQIQKEMNDDMKSINDFKRKMRFIKRFYTVKSLIKRTSSVYVRLIEMFAF